MQSRIAPIAEELQTADLSGDTELIRNASQLVKGKVIVFDGAGEVVMAYDNSHEVSTADMSYFAEFLRQTKEYQSVLDGEQYQKFSNFGESVYFIEIGIPIVWEGQRSVLVLTNYVDEIYRVLRINRQQLVTLTIVLTIISGVVAWILSKRFAKPIHTIKDSVEKLAEGDLTARPDLRRKDELGQLSDSVGELSTALKRIDVLRHEVIANVSHELSAPLSLIIGYGEMVRDVTWRVEEKRNDNLNLIIREARRMSNMVDDIMDYSQFQAGYMQLKKEEYNLYEIIETEVESGRQATKAYGITIDLQSESRRIPVLVDALKISQVMRNLLNNAINHTEDNETILVAISQHDGGVKVSVANPGKPIPSEKLGMIWERYYSSQHKGSRRQGTGIGLSIVSTILQAHGYSFGVGYEDNRNSFWFIIPPNDEKR